MRVARLILGSVLVATAMAVPAAAHPMTPHPSLLPAVTPRVTGAVQPFSSYRRQGLSQRAAERLLQLDHLARTGVSTQLLNAALSASEASAAPTEPTQVWTSLDPVGNLDGRGADEVLDSRFVVSGSAMTVQLIVRDGTTGRAMWTRTDRLHGDGFEFALGAPVAGKPGVMVLRMPFDKPETLIALDGRGHQVWQRSLADDVHAPAPPPAFGVITYEGSYHYTYMLFDEPIRRGSHEILRVDGDVRFSGGDVGGGTTGAVGFSAISQVTGAVRALPGATSSSDGAVLGDTQGDVDGDGLTDLVVGVGGSTHSVTSLRAIDGKRVWSRADAFSGDLNGLGVVSPVTGEHSARGLTEDVVVLTAPKPAPVAGLPALTTSGPSALLLGGRTGRTAWSKPGDGVYLVGRSGVRALGVWTDSSSTVGAEDVAQADVTVYDAAGRTRWQKSYRRTHPKHDASDQAFVLVGSVGDLDGDGGEEGLVLFGFFTASGGDGSLGFFRSSDGKAIPLPMDDLLGGHVRRGPDDLVRVTSTAAGLLVVVTDPRRHQVVWRRTVPGTKGMSGGWAQGSPISHHGCVDVLVTGSGHGRASAAVLASSGDLRWAVTRSNAAVGTVVRPATAARISC